MKEGKLWILIYTWIKRLEDLVTREGIASVVVQNMTSQSPVLFLSTCEISLEHKINHIFLVFVLVAHHAHGFYSSKRLELMSSQSVRSSFIQLSNGWAKKRTPIPTVVQFYLTFKLLSLKIEGPLAVRSNFKLISSQVLFYC